MEERTRPRHNPRRRRRLRHLHPLGMLFPLQKRRTLPAHPPFPQPSLPSLRLAYRHRGSDVLRLLAHLASGSSVGVRPLT